MPLAPAIERHRKPLLRIVATLFAMIGLSEGKTVERLAPSVYRKVLRLLRPAESAVRRLIVVAARGITLKPPATRPAARTSPHAVSKRRPRITFRLFDPRQRFGSAFGDERIRHRIRLTPQPEPRIRVIDVSFDPRIPLFRQPPPAVPEPQPQPVVPDGMLNARRLSCRLAAIRSALEDLPRQARRYLRWQSKPHEQRRPPFASALRPGSPPGHRSNPIHKVDEILAECDWLARHPPQADTS